MSEKNGGVFYRGGPGLWHTRSMNRVARPQLIFALTAVILGMLAPPGAVPQRLQAARATLRFDKTTILSTEEAVAGSLIVENPGPETLAIDLSTARFTVVHDDGREEEQNMLVSSGRTMDLHPEVKPGASSFLRIATPRCGSAATSCTERVGASVEVSLGNGSVVLRAPEVTITFIRDLNATYEGPGVGDNRPAFITQGDATEQLQAYRMELVFTLPFEPPPGAADDRIVAAVLGAHGLQDDGSGSASTRRTGWEIAVPLSGEPSLPAARAALADIERRMPGRASGGSIRYIPGGNGDVGAALASRAEMAASDEARHLSQLIGSGDVRRTYLGGSVGIVEARVSRPGSDPTLVGVPDTSTIYMAAAVDRPSTVEVGARVFYAYVGAREGRLPPETFLGPVARLEQPVLSASEIAWQRVVATTESDRPEIFAVGQTTAERAEGLGYRPEALATLLAARRVRLLATSLSVAPGPPTLLVNYPREASHEKAIVASGVAVAPEGDLDRAWRRMAAAAIPQPNSATAMSAEPTPSAPPAFGSAHAGDVPPISFPEEATQISVRSDLPETSAGDHFRLSLAVNHLAPAESFASATDAVVRDLRSLPYVDDVAVEVSGAESPSIGYQLVLRKAGLDLPRRIVDRVAATYHVSASTISFSLAPLANCSALAFNAQKHSLDRALLDAVVRARAQGKTLSHLILVVALPIQAVPVDACDLQARSDALERATRQAAFQSIVVRAPVQLVFRFAP